MARYNKAHICGPKLSICCSLLSIWGIVMLVIVGGLMSAHSAAFIEDIPLPAVLNETNLAEELNQAYSATATNCYGAAAVYAGFLIFCTIQVFFNLKASAAK